MTHLTFSILHNQLDGAKVLPYKPKNKKKKINEFIFMTAWSIEQSDKHN
jgi:hypothetical protein